MDHRIHLPTLVMPPLSERLSLRYQPGIDVSARMVSLAVNIAVMGFWPHDRGR